MENERVELHCHTCMSQMNVVSSVYDIFTFAQKEGMNAIAFTDHNTISAYPEIQRLTEKRFRGIKPIYGVEFLVTEDILPQTENMSKVRNDGLPSYYVLALAQNETGLKNMYQLITEACTIEDKHPRITWSRLIELREGLLIGSACVAGEVFHSLMRGIPEEIVRKIAVRYDFLELQPATNDIWILESEKTAGIKCIEDIRNIQSKIIEIGDTLGIPVVASSDAHYVTSKNAISRKILVNARGWGDESQGDLHIRTTKEMLEEFSFLPHEKAYEIVVTNTNKLADLIESITPVPKCKFVPSIEDSDKKLKEICEKSVLVKYGKNGNIPEHVLDRLSKELKDIATHGFAEIYLHSVEIIRKNKLRPSQYGLKGRGASSIVAYLLGISKEDPLSCECPLYAEVFVGINGNKEPNFELVVDENVWKQVRQSLNDLEGVEEAVCATSFISPSEAKITSWIEDYEIDKDEIVLEPDRSNARYDLQNVLVAKGRRTPGKFYIVPNNKKQLFPKERDLDNVENVYPFRWWDIRNVFYSYNIHDSRQRAFLCRLEKESGMYPDDDAIKTAEVIDGIPSLIGCVDLGEDVDIWKDILQYYKPCSFADVVRIISLVHGTGVWYGNGEKLLSDGVVTCEDIIANFEELYETLMHYGMPKEKAYEITEFIGKGKMHYEKYHPEYAEEMLQYGIPEWFVESCGKIKYLFSRAHSAEYANLLLCLVYYKMFYPEEFSKIQHELFTEKSLISCRNEQ